MKEKDGIEEYKRIIAEHTLNWTHQYDEDIWNGMMEEKHEA